MLCVASSIRALSEVLKLGKAGAHIERGAGVHVKELAAHLKEIAPGRLVLFMSGYPEEVMPDATPHE